MTTWAVFGLTIGFLLIPTVVRAANVEARWAGLPIVSQIISIKKMFVVSQAKADEIGSILPQSGQREADKVVNAVFTAYTSTPDQTDSDPFIAASGKHVYDGMIAANWLPFGTKIKIPSLYGDKIFTVDDRMNPRYGYGRMDIWLNASKAEARQFGVKRVEIEIFYDFNKNK